MLEPEDTINVEATFAPTEVGFDDAYLLLFSNIPGNHSFIPLQGTGVDAYTPVLEPVTVMLIGIGLVGFGIPRIRKKFKK